MTHVTPLVVALTALTQFSAFLPYVAPEPAPVPVVYGQLDDPRFIAPEQFRAWIDKYAAEFGVPRDVAIRLPFEESGWIQYLTVRNRNGTYDHDMFQLNSRYHHVLTTEANIREGLKYWSWCWRKTGKIYDATLAYICGLRGMATPTKSAKREAWAVLKGDV